MHPREKYVTPNLRKACKVLKKLSDFPQGLDLAALSRELGIPRTTALRICVTLELENLLARNHEGRYVLGSGLAPLGMRALPNPGLRELAVPLLARVVGATQETAHLAVLCGKNSLLLEVHDSPHQLRVASRPGTLAHLHCSSTGKVFLAWSIYMPIEKFLEGVNLERRTPRTLTTIAELAEEIQKVRQRGYAVDDEEYLAGVRCIAAPVRDTHNHVIAAIGITGVASRFVCERVEPYSHIIMDAAREFSEALGARRTPEPAGV